MSHIVTIKTEVRDVEALGLACRQGQVRYDNFEGRWGEPTHLNRLLQSYCVEKSSHSQCTPCNGFN